ncbi:MAG: hypothetical protein UR77_C0011G0003 [Candidatus Nomurabacteria bacterium GW2011_GWC2_35_35]|nr:MAG: hypothetical protein UR77_C0011G0003 [Candidatus Nomurabacteria bacterium GW2011_GWC2_35_35]
MPLLVRLATGNLTASKTYTLTCTGPGGNSAPASATVTVGAQPPMSGTLTPASSSCIIASGSSSCNINYSWTTTNPQATSAITKPVNVTVATGNSGTNVPFAVKYNSETFYLYNNSVLLNQSTVTSSCDSSTSSWNSSTGKCEPFSPTVTISASPTSVAYNGSSTLTWSSTNATSCTASTGNLTASKTYTLTCTGPGGNSAPASATVTVGVSAPTVTISASPTSVAYNGSSTLTWSSTNATSCTASGDWSGAKAISGTQSTGALTASKTYTLTCTGPGGISAPASATVIVGAQPPIVSIFASPSSIDYNQNSIITWESTYATSCTATGDWSGAKAIGGPHSQSTGNLTSSKTYVLTCTGAGGNTSNSTTVTVGAPVMFGTLIPESNSCVIASGNNSCNINFSWSITNPEGATTAITANEMTDVNLSGSSGNQSLPVPYLSSPRIFYLYNNAKSLVPTSESPNGSGVTVTSDCVSGTSWNGSICIVFSPTATLTASPRTIVIGSSSVLTWSSTNTTSCTGTGFDTGGATSDNATVSPLSTTTYSIVCTGPGGQAIDQATVTVTTADNVPIFKED